MTQQQSFTCAACGGSFSTEEALKAHAQQAHAAPEQQSFRCGACGGTFDTQAALQEHARASHAR